VQRLETRLDGPMLIAPAVHRDARGFFHESYRLSRVADFGITEAFVQDNHSRSVRGVVRGMHFMLGGGTSKLVRCGRGSIYDVVVDLRRASPTFGIWEAFELSDENLHQLYVPVGFAHGFCVTSEVADVLYKQSAYFDAALEREIAYDDPDVGIEWPAGIELIVSERDSGAPRLAEIASGLPF
jgi:dTDP-4-dehydrorhamnose 3,5-epimerase